MTKLDTVIVVTENLIFCSINLIYLDHFFFNFTSCKMTLAPDTKILESFNTSSFEQHISETSRSYSRNHVQIHGTYLSGRDTDTFRYTKFLKCQIKKGKCY